MMIVSQRKLGPYYNISYLNKKYESLFIDFLKNKDERFIKQIFPHESELVNYMRKIANKYGNIQLESNMSKVSISNGNIIIGAVTIKLIKI